MSGTRFESFFARLVKMHINELMDLEVDLDELIRNESNQPTNVVRRSIKDYVCCYERFEFVYPTTSYIFSSPTTTPNPATSIFTR